MKTLFRILMSSLTLVVALSLLTAPLGCDDCENYCQEQFDECVEESGSERQGCSADLERCLGICASQPREEQD